MLDHKQTLFKCPPNKPSLTDGDQVCTHCSRKADEGWMRSWQEAQNVHACPILTLDKSHMSESYLHLCCGLHLVHKAIQISAQIYYFE